MPHIVLPLFPRGFEHVPSKRADSAAKRKKNRKSPAAPAAAPLQESTSSPAQVKASHPAKKSPLQLRVLGVFWFTGLRQKWVFYSVLQSCINNNVLLLQSGNFWRVPRWRRLERRKSVTSSRWTLIKSLHGTAWLLLLLQMQCDLSYAKFFLLKATCFHNYTVINNQIFSFRVDLLFYTERNCYFCLIDWFICRLIDWSIDWLIACSLDWLIWFDLSSWFYGIYFQIWILMDLTIISKQVPQ